MFELKKRSMCGPYSRPKEGSTALSEARHLISLLNSLDGIFNLKIIEEAFRAKALGRELLLVIIIFCRFY